MKEYLLIVVTRFSCSYKILNPAAVTKESDPKKCAAHILDATGLDPENYRLGHTKACPYPICVLVLLSLRPIDWRRSC